MKLFGDFISALIGAGVAWTLYAIWHHDTDTIVGVISSLFVVAIVRAVANEIEEES